MADKKEVLVILDGYPVAFSKLEVECENEEPDMLCHPSKILLTLEGGEVIEDDGSRIMIISELMN